MSKIKTAIQLLFRDRKSLMTEIVKHFFVYINDEIYLSYLFKYRMGYPLNLSQPKTYCEKLQWLKLYDHRPEYTLMVDKYRVKEYVSKKIGEEFVIPTIGVWNSEKEIDWNVLPDQFVLKTTHGGGGSDVIICTDKTCFNKKEALVKLKASMRKNSYKYTREWPYKDVKKQIIAESYLEEPGFSAPRDYKVLCFNGVAKLIQLHEGRFSSQHTQSFYDCNWNKLPINQRSYGVISDNVTEKPSLLGKMIELSEILANGIPHARIDWYIVKEHLYFGEITFFDASGFDSFIPDEYNYILSDWITLPKKTV